MKRALLMAAKTIGFLILVFCFCVVAVAITGLGTGILTI